MNFLKAALQTKPTTPSLVTLLKSNMEGLQADRGHERVHASDITKPHFCPREVLLLDTLKKNRPPRWVDAALRATFDVGNVTADLVREKWLGKDVFGDWSCRICGLFVGFARKPDALYLSTTPCSKHDWRYCEMRFESPLGFEGSLDAVVDLGLPKLTLVEIKIIKPEEFEKLTAPLAEHRVRTNLYMRMVESASSDGRIDCQSAKVLYVSRGYGKKHPHHGVMPFREFDVARCDADLDAPLKRAAAVRDGRKLNVLPERVCAVSYQPEAKSCSVVNECFSGKFHGNST